MEALARRCIAASTSPAFSVANPKLSANSFAPFPASYQSGPLNSSNFFCPTACFKALEIAMYAPVNPFVAISHLAFSGIVSILSAIGFLLVDLFQSWIRPDQPARRVSDRSGCIVTHGPAPREPVLQFFRSTVALRAAATANGHDNDLRRTPIMGSTRRNILATGAAATAMAAAQRVLAQQTGKGGAAMPVYEKGPVRIHYEEAGSGFPLLLIAGGGLNSTITGLTRGGPFNPIEEFKGEFRCIAADLRNANTGQSSGPLEIDRPWD